MSKLLITGAGGYIGSVATQIFLKLGHEVVALDNFSRGYRGPLELLQREYGKEKLRWYEADLTGDLSHVFDQERNIDTCIHYGALCSVPESMAHPELYFRVDAWGAFNLVDHLVRHGCGRLVFSSTCAVYGESEYLPLDEKHPLNPISPYGASKKMAEDAFRSYHETKGLSVIMLRYFNVCGASEDSQIGDSKRPSFHLMQNAVRGALGIEAFKLQCPTVDTPDGTPIRDYVDVVDLNDAHVRGVDLLLRSPQPICEAINLGSGEGNSVLQIVKAVESVTGREIPLTRGETRQGDPARLYANPAKAKEMLGWQPKRSLTQSVETLVAWYNHHPNGWEK